MNITTKHERAVPLLPPQPSAVTPRQSDAGALAFVWGIWLLKLAASLTLCGAYASNVPLSDDWHSMVPVVTGQEPPTFSWLWSQHAEHRIPLARVVYLTSNLLAGGDFRAVVVFGIGILCALAAATILVARTLRGWTDYTDAFFPLALINLGQIDTFVWGWQIAFVLPIVLAVAFLLVIVQARSSLTTRAALLAGTCLVLLPLCGPPGLALVPPLAVWLSLVGVRLWSSPEPGVKRRGVLVFGFVLAALLLTGFYFVGYQRPTNIPHSPSHGATLQTSLEFLGMGIGHAATALSPFAGVGVLSLLFVTAGVLCVKAWRCPVDRLRSLGLLAPLVGTGCLALGLGWGRAGYGFGSAFQDRYVILGVPALFSVYFTWGLLVAPAGRFVPMCLLTLMLLLLPINLMKTYKYAAPSRAGVKAFERDLVAGMPLSILIERHAQTLVHPAPPSDIHKQQLASRLSMLKQAGIGKFRFLGDDPTFQEISLPVAPVAVNRLKWRDGVGYGFGHPLDRSSLTFALKDPQHVFAIRLKYSYEAALDNDPTFQISWRKSHSQELTEPGNYRPERSYPLPVSAEKPTEQSLIIWVNDTIDQFRIYPASGAFVFRISEIALLVPGEEASCAPP